MAFLPRVEAGVGKRKARSQRIDASLPFDDVLRLTRAGDERAMTELWYRFHPRMVRYLRGMCAPHHEDVAIAVWIDVANGLNRFEGDADGFRRWLFTIARRRYIDHVRSATRRVHAVSTEVVDELVDFGGIDHYDDLESALHLVRRLPDPQRDVVLLRTIGGLDVSEVAEILGRTEGSVRVLAHRGLKRLADMVEPPVSVDARSRSRVAEDVS